jgi:hypothetical protein
LGHPKEKDLRYAFPARLLALLLAGSLTVGCDNGDTPTSPTPPPTVTETFTGVVTRNGSTTHSFIATAAGTVTATITSISPATSPAIGFSIGTFDGTNCTATSTNNFATTSAVHSGTVVGITSLCVRLFDPSSVVPEDAPVNYTVTVQRP